MDEQKSIMWAIRYVNNATKNKKTEIAKIVHVQVEKYGD